MKLYQFLLSRLRFWINVLINNAREIIGEAARNFHDPKVLLYWIAMKEKMGMKLLS